MKPNQIQWCRENVKGFREMERRVMALREDYAIKYAVLKEAR